MNNLSSRFLTENLSWYKKYRYKKYINKKWINKSVFHLPTTCCLFICLSPHNFSSSMSKLNTISVLGPNSSFHFDGFLSSLFSHLARVGALSPVLSPLTSAFIKVPLGLSMSGIMNQLSSTPNPSNCFFPCCSLAFIHLSSLTHQKKSGGKRDYCIWS